MNIVLMKKTCNKLMDIDTPEMLFKGNYRVLGYNF